MKMNDIESRAQEYITKHSEYSEDFGLTFVAVDTLTAMVEFTKQETKEILNQANKAKELLQKCLNTYLRDPELRNEVERFFERGNMIKAIISCIIDSIKLHHEFEKELRKIKKLTDKNDWISFSYFYALSKIFLPPATSQGKYYF